MISMITSLFAGRGVKILLAVAIASGIAGGAWYFFDRLEDQATTIQQLKDDKRDLQGKVLNQERTVNAIKKQIQSVQEFNDYIDSRLDRSDQEVEELNTMLGNVDLEAMAKNDPEQVQELFNSYFQNQIACIEKASGNANAKCTRTGEDDTPKE